MSIGQRLEWAPVAITLVGTALVCMVRVRKFAEIHTRFDRLEARFDALEARCRTVEQPPSRAEADR